MKIALEWYLNPDHLPLLAAREAGVDLTLIAPDDHYDGFEALAAGDVTLVVNEPLHLVESRPLTLRAHGTFFSTEGGVLIRRTALDALKAGAAIRIASPVSGATTDALCRDILAAWLGRPLGEGQVTIESAGFAHVDNIAAGFDGAWLAFANVEGVDARLRGLDTVMVTTAEAGLPEFSALELIGRADAAQADLAAIAALRESLDRVIPQLIANPQAARTLWYRASTEPESATTDAIVADTLRRLVAPVRADAARWRPMWRYMADHGGDVVDASTYEAMF
ncbi:ABC transporter substrate-binding protein [Polymorphobacter multimanifer]|uniref:ABC transporter substrate-binding protein n=1 Tax=Polymorphobacter multimanifer TaxID=1070431 RepID=UPI0016645DB1|nr:ABC transporter substrate-binding protein [Polymorphobacter multimanifer]GGI89458.1 ABC transporter substrate-binding protein [Polymorphobacter multimanifer]